MPNCYFALVELGQLKISWVEPRGPDRIEDDVPRRLGEQHDCKLSPDSIRERTDRHLPGAHLRVLFKFLDGCANAYCVVLVR